MVKRYVFCEMGADYRPLGSQVTGCHSFYLLGVSWGIAP